MNDTGASTALAALLDADPDAADRAEVGVLMRHARTLRGFLDVAEVRFARRLRELAAQGRSESVAAALMDEGRRSGKEAHATRDREELCDRMPAFEEALAAGAVSSDHLDALAKIAKGLDDTTRSDLFARADELVEMASSDYVSHFEQRCRTVVDELRGERAEADAQAKLERQRRQSRVRHWVDDTTGMHKTLVELDPVRDAAWWSTIQEHLATIRQHDGNADRPIQELEVEALIAAVSSGAAAHRVPEVLVVVDDRTLASGHHGGTVCELSDGTTLPVDTVRRMCCEAVIVALTADPEGQPLSVGREHRTATRAQRRALRALYRTCAHPECTVAFDRCRVHHVVFWRHGGCTDLSNLLPLCEQHHHLVHEGGWRIEIDPADRTVTWVRPDGTPWRTSRPDRRPEHPLGRRQERAPDRRQRLVRTS